MLRILGTLNRAFWAWNWYKRVIFRLLRNPALFAILLHFCLLWTKVSNTWFVVCHLRQGFRATLMILTNEIKELRFWILSRPDLGKNVSQLTEIVRDHASWVRCRILITTTHFRKYDQAHSRLSSVEIVITTSNSRIYEHSLWKWSSVEMFTMLAHPRIFDHTLSKWGSAEILTVKTYSGTFKHSLSNKVRWKSW